MREAIFIEWQKIKGTKAWMPLLFLPLVSVLYGSVNYANNTELLQSEWISLWTQVYLFYGLFFLPGLIGFFASYIWSGEHRGNNMNLLLTSVVPPRIIIFSKTATVFLAVLCGQCILAVLYAVAGSFFHFSSAFPVGLFPYLLLSTALSLCMIAVQIFLSLKIRSFGIPVAISVAISILAVLVSQNPELPILQYLTPNVLITLAMNHFPDTGLTAADSIGMAIGAAAIFALATAMSIRALHKKIL